MANSAFRSAQVLAYGHTKKDGTEKYTYFLFKQDFHRLEALYLEKMEDQRPEPADLVKRAISVRIGEEY